MFAPAEIIQVVAVDIFVIRFGVTNVQLW